MTIGFRQAATANTGGATSLACNKPAGVVDGDVLYAVVSTTGGPLTVTPPAGWNLVPGADKQHSGAANFQLRVYYKVASGEGANYTFGFSLSTTASIGIIADTGVDNGTPIDVVSASTNDGSDTSPIGLSVTTATNNAWLAWCCALNSGSVTITEPAGFNERYEVTSNARNEGSDFEQASAGVSGNKTGTNGASRDWIVIMFALKPAGGGPTGWGALLSDARNQLVLA